MSKAGSSSDKPRPETASCQHDYRLDTDLEEWVCTKCGKALSLVAQEKHECGPDCEKHGDIAAIG